MLASTVQFSRYGRRPILNPRVRPGGRRSRRMSVEPGDLNGHEGRAKARSLRTQQCAYDSDYAVSQRSTRSTSEYLPGLLIVNELVSVPPLSYLRETFAHEQASGRHPLDAA